MTELARRKYGSLAKVVQLFWASSAIVNWLWLDTRIKMSQLIKHITKASTGTVQYIYYCDIVYVEERKMIGIQINSSLKVLYQWSSLWLHLYGSGSDSNCSNWIQFPKVSLPNWKKRHFPFTWTLEIWYLSILPHWRCTSNAIGNEELTVFCLMGIVLEVQSINHIENTCDNNKLNKECAPAFPIHCGVWSKSSEEDQEMSLGRVGSEEGFLSVAEVLMRKCVVGGSGECRHNLRNKIIISMLHKYSLDFIQNLINW